MRGLTDQKEAEREREIVVSIELWVVVIVFILWQWCSHDVTSSAVQCKAVSLDWVIWKLQSKSLGFQRLACISSQNGIQLFFKDLNLYPYRGVKQWSWSNPNSNSLNLIGLRSGLCAGRRSLEDMLKREKLNLIMPRLRKKYLQQLKELPPTFFYLPLIMFGQHYSTLLFIVWYGARHSLYHQHHFITTYIQVK